MLREYQMFFEDNLNHVKEYYRTHDPFLDGWDVLDTYRCELLGMLMLMRSCGEIPESQERKETRKVNAAFSVRNMAKTYQAAQ